jgi:hypothetical protein
VPPIIRSSENGSLAAALAILFFDGGLVKSIYSINEQEVVA